ncbi:MAG: four helix bundle protein [Candidatus Margulisbacteria bacterium]|nr:four helix bundle protein [Candidatus Margulisiibacteriota bacterium]
MGYWGSGVGISGDWGTRKMPTFRDLRIWQEAISLMMKVHELCKTLPKEERFQLIDQASRSASSVPDNIAEGYTSYHYKDKINRFYDSRKEAGETQNHIIKMEKKYYIKREVAENLFNEYLILIKGINGYVNYLKRKRGDIR